MTALRASRSAFTILIIFCSSSKELQGHGFRTRSDNEMFQGTKPLSISAPNITSNPVDVLNVANLNPHQLKAVIDRESAVVGRTAAEFKKFTAGEASHPEHGAHSAATPDQPPRLLPGDPIYIDFTNLAGSTSKHFALYIGKYRESAGDPTEYVIEFAGGRGKFSDQLSSITSTVDRAIRVRTLDSFSKRGKRTIFKPDAMPRTVERVQAIRRSLNSLGMQKYNMVQIGAENCESVVSYWLNGEFRSEQARHWKLVLCGVSVVCGIIFVGTILMARRTRCNFCCGRRCDK